jgi:hypothetical protein
MGVYKSDSWTKASVFNPLTGDVALMTTLIGGETFLAPQEEITQETTNGNYISQWRHRVQFACSDWDAFDTLQGFKDAHIAVQAVAAAESLNCANLQWHESVQIKELRKVPKARRADGDSHFIVVLEYEGDENAAIFNNVNLLHQTNVNGVVVTGFVDGDGNDIADGYTTGVSSTNLDFTDSVQSLDTGNPLSGIYRQVIFPITGTLGLISNVLAAPGSQARLVAQLKNFAGTIVETDEKNTGLGSDALDITVTSTIYSIRVYPISRRESGSNGTLSVKEPCLRTDGSTEYIAG